MALLDIAVLVGVARLDGLTLQLVVPQQRLVASGEKRRACGPRRNGGGQPIGAVPLRDTAQFPQRVLQPFAQALVALRETDRARLPVRVGEHEVVDQVVERDALDGHAQVGAVREVAGAQPTGVMDLGKEHFLGRAVQGTPLFDVSLQGPQLAVGEASRVTSLQVVEQGFGLQSGVEPQLFFELRPDLVEGIGACAIVSVHASHLAG
jgi:hypothetical protein